MVGDTVVCTLLDPRLEVATDVVVSSFLFVLVCSITGPDVGCDVSGNELLVSGLFVVGVFVAGVFVAGP